MLGGSCLISDGSGTEEDEAVGCTASDITCISCKGGVEATKTSRFEGVAIYRVGEDEKMLASRSRMSESVGPASESPSLGVAAFCCVYLVSSF